MVDYTAIVSFLQRVLAQSIDCFEYKSKDTCQLIRYVLVLCALVLTSEKKHLFGFIAGKKLPK